MQPTSYVMLIFRTAAWRVNFLNLVPINNTIMPPPPSSHTISPTGDERRAGLVISHT